MYSATGYGQECSLREKPEWARCPAGIQIGGSNVTVTVAQPWATLTRNVSRIIESARTNFVCRFGVIPSFSLAVRVLDEEGYRRVSGAPQWTQAIFRRGEILLSVTSLDPEEMKIFNRSVRHEYTHAVVYALSGGHAPGWLDEGLAQWAEGPQDASLQEALDRWLLHHRPISLSLLQGGFVKLSPNMVAPAYGESFAATNYLLSRFGAIALRRFFDLLQGDVEREAAFQRAFSISEHDFEAQFFGLL